jgi:Flp pilus assembly protein TadG
MTRFTKRVSRRCALPRVLRRLCGNERGNISMVAAASLPVLFGFGGLAVDVSLWLKSANSVQGAADAAAISVAAAATAGDSKVRDNLGNLTGGLAVTEGYAVAAANGYTNGQSGVAVAIYHPRVSPSAFAGTVDTYQAVISTPKQR